MSSKFIELQDGLLVEVQADEDDPQQISAGVAKRVDGSLATVEQLLRKVASPVAAVWGELNRDLTIEQVEINLALGFEAEGRAFIARGKGSANVSFKLIVKPKEEGS